MKTQNVNVLSTEEMGKLSGGGRWEWNDITGSWDLVEFHNLD